jgi:NAD(P)-dependent dehydrogenase (short-subunit alcohol dehydrogenase family)
MKEVPGIILDGQVVVVTGAGRGMGRAHALGLARLGANIVVNDLRGSMDYGEDPNHSTADDVVAQIQAAGGSAVASYESVARPEGCAAIVAQAVDAFGRVDAIVHNAGIRRHMYFEKMTLEDISSVVDTHLGGGLWLTHAAWPLMQAQGGGRIVLISSGAGAFGMVGVAQYAAAKSGLIGLGKALALEGGPHGIVVNTVLPTARTHDLDAPTAGRTTVHEREGMRRKFTQRDSPEFVTPLVAYLVSPACVVTGEVYSAVRARYALAFTGLTQGWQSPDDLDVTPDDIEDHLEQIRRREGYWIPSSVQEEVDTVHAAASPAE